MLDVPNLSAYYWQFTLYIITDLNKGWKLRLNRTSTCKEPCIATIYMLYNMTPPTTASQKWTFLCWRASRGLGWWRRWMGELWTTKNLCWLGWQLGWWLQLCAGRYTETSLWKMYYLRNDAIHWLVSSWGMACSNLVKDLDQPKVISLTMHIVPGVVCLRLPISAGGICLGQHILLYSTTGGVLGMKLCRYANLACND